MVRSNVPLCFRNPAGFMTYVVEPLFAEWARFSDTRLSQTMLGHLCLNKASWKALQPEEAEFEQESGSRALPQGSVESWHCLAPPRPALKLQSLLILLASHLKPTTDLFNLFNFNTLLFFPFDIEQYMDTSFSYCCEFHSFFFFFFLMSYFIYSK